MGENAENKRFTVRSLIIVLLLAILIPIGCLTGKKSETPGGKSGENSAETQTLPKRRVIIDTDTGADDSSAIILAAKTENVEILGVTVLVGNVDLEQSARNALMALEIAGSDAKVYKGASENASGEKIEAFSVFGSDGMGDAGLINPKRSAEEKDAVDFILETVNRYPNEVEIIAIGPATNIARAIERDPETMKKVKMIWSMGTTGLGPGNASPVAEFNVYSDPVAYREFLDSGVRVTIVGLDMCSGEAQWTGEQFEKLSKTNETGKFVAKSFGKLREFYAGNGSESVMNCDALAMACVLYPGFVNKTISCHGSCITEAGETRAQVIFYQEGFTYDTVANDFEYNVTLVTDVDKDKYFNLFLDAIK